MGSRTFNESVDDLLAVPPQPSVGYSELREAHPHSDKPMLRDTQFEVLNSKKIRRLYAEMKKDWPIMVLGTFGALGCGVMYPLMSVLTAYIMGIFYTTDPTLSIEENASSIINDASVACGYMFAVAAAGGICVYLQWEGWGRAGEHIVYNLRRRVFRTVMYQDMEFFDDPLNNTGRISSIITADCGLTRGVTGANGALICQSIATLVVAMVFAFLGHPALAAVCCSTYFLLIPAIYLQMSFTKAVRSSLANGTLVQDVSSQRLIFP